MKKMYLIGAVLAGSCTLHAQEVQVGIDYYNAVCGVGGCTTLLANYSSVNQTTGYNVAAIPFAPVLPTTGGVILNASADDIWSPTIDLPFNFSFFGSTYNQMLVGSNGVVTFDLLNHSAGGFCNWSFSQVIPNATFPIRNAIYGVYQDTDISSDAYTGSPLNAAVQNVNYYVLSSGTYAAPNRVFVVNFSNLPQFQCGSSGGLQTQQIVLREGSNTIDVYVFNRTPCNAWNGGRGIIGIQNQAGTQAVVPAGRNTGNWNATNEAWRFEPAGAPVSANLSWFANGVWFGNSSPIELCIDATTTVTASVQYEGMDAPVTNELVFSPYVYDVSNPADIAICTTELPPFTANLTSNTAVVLANIDQPQNFEVTYYGSEQDATDNAAQITMPASYLFDQNTTIYMRIEELAESGCVFVAPFQLLINPVPDAPSGLGIQNFNQGQTLNELVVSGQNILWYDAPQGGNLLPSATILVNNTTYYASQTVNDCESRISPGRLAVTTMVTLGNLQFNAAEFKLYPNPATSHLNVQFTQSVDQLELFNLVGQRIMVKYNLGKNFDVDVNQLSAGTYFVKVISGKGSLVSKFIKK